MMPVIFVGHGSPMNAVEENGYTKGWQEISASIPKPEAVLAISAHWYTDGTRLQTAKDPKMIYDFYGFPQELYDVEYPAHGSPRLAKKALGLVGGSVEDNSWGIDHGTWSVLKWMYPDADIPVCQMSIDRRLTLPEIYETGKKLKSLRDENVLILGSGNVVHNLRLVDFSASGGYDWAEEFDAYIRSKIEARDHGGVIDCKKAGDSARLAFPTQEHFDPLLYILGATDAHDRVEVYNDSCTLGSLSMTSYIFRSEN